MLELARADAAPLPIYDGLTRLLDWGQTGRRGMWVDLRLVLPGRDGSHPFEGYKHGPDSGQRMRVLSRLPTGELDVAGPVLYEGEAMLLNWSTTAARGPMVRLQLDDTADGVVGTNPFFGYEIGLNGEPIELLTHAISDDERIVDPGSVRKRLPFHQLTAVQQSNIIGNRPEFVRFLGDNLDSLIDDPDERASLRGMADRRKTFSDAVIRAYLRVPSRAIMNQDGSVAVNARVRWAQLLRRFETDLHGIR